MYLSLPRKYLSRFLKMYLYVHVLKYKVLKYRPPMIMMIEGAILEYTTDLKG